ncbi:MAG: zinc ribbon domain-containing protein [Deltaproteobacteria bacterium]|nr:zinc ribbon domain-containing protein [Deltaproteobacteria bacterium]
MPIYEYQCKACSQITEEIQKFSDPPLKTCPSCGGKVKKVMSQNTFHLKGSGWYVTDYASKNSTSTAKSDKSTKQGTETSAATATPTETKTTTAE